MENGILMWGLIGFGSLVLIFQATPAVIMFGAMVRGLFKDTKEMTKEVI